MKNLAFMSLVFAVLFLAGCAPKSYLNQEYQAVEESFSRNESAIYRSVNWQNLPNWKKDNHAEALSSFVNSCKVMQNDPRWKKVCLEAFEQDLNDSVGARIFFETHFLPYEVIADGQRKKGLITGYYLPVLNGSRTKTERYRYPIYKKPSDLVIVESALFGRNERSFRGRITADQKIVPYYTRAEIDAPKSPLAGQELLFVDDDIALFFLHIQGSGFVKLPNGERVQVNYDGQNGQKYHAIGKTLIDEGKIARDGVSLQSIRDYLISNPNDKQRVLNTNPSYIFFKEGNISEGVTGTQGAKLTSGRSLAVDRGLIDLGTPIFLEFDHPQKVATVSKLLVAQDTGGAIKGAVRADYFWGESENAEESAGNMKSEGKIWVLLPKEAL